MNRRLPILTFHDFDDGGSVISFPPRLFERGLLVLRARGWRTVTLREAARCLREGDPIPEQSFVITIDDGSQSVRDHAWPALRRLGMTATVFLTAGRHRPPRNGDERLPDLDGRAMLRWSEIRAMMVEGIEFGAHTLTHPDLTRIGLAEAREEIVSSKAVLQQALGAEVHSFCYPYGRHNRQLRDIARDHFECACTDALGLVTRKSDRYALQRIDAYYLRSERLLSAVTRPWFPAYLRLRRVPRDARRWAAGRRRPV